MAAGTVRVRRDHSVSGCVDSVYAGSLIYVACPASPARRAHLCGPAFRSFRYVVNGATVFFRRAEVVQAGSSRQAGRPVTQLTTWLTAHTWRAQVLGLSGNRGQSVSLRQAVRVGYKVQRTGW
jgi:hypothetical protein